MMPGRDAARPEGAGLRGAACIKGRPVSRTAAAVAAAAGILLLAGVLAPIYVSPDVRDDWPFAALPVFLEDAFAMIDAETARGTVTVHNHQVMAGDTWTLMVMEESDGWLSIAMANGTILGEDIRLAGARGPFGAPITEPLVDDDSILAGGPLMMFTIISLEVATPGQHAMVITVDGQATPVTITSVGVPAVTLVNYTAPAGLYGLGRAIPVEVSFSEPVTLVDHSPAGPSPAWIRPTNASAAVRDGNNTGAPSFVVRDGHYPANLTSVNGSLAGPSPAWIHMNVSGDIRGVALYLDGNNTDTLYFEYHVQEGHHSANLTHVDGSSVQLNRNATLVSVAYGVDADLALPEQDGSSIIVDGVRPQAVSARYESGMLDITFTEGINHFNLTGLHLMDGSDDRTMMGMADGGRAATIDGATVNLELTAEQREAVTGSNHPMLRLDRSAARDMANNTSAIAYMEIDVRRSTPAPVFVFPSPAPPANRAPVFNQTIPQQNVTEHEPVALAVNATDPDGPDHLITYLMDGAPSGARLDPASGAFRWTPGEAQDGTWTITFKARDGQGKAGSLPVVINVTEVNVDPALPAVPDQAAYEETTLEFGIVATDADLPPNRLAYSLVGATHGASINGETGLFSWTPTEEQGGSASNPYSFTVMVEDGRGGSDQVSFDVTANEATENNHQPVLTLPDDIPSSIDEHDTLTFNATATDQDVPFTPTFGLVGVTHGATIGPSTGTFAWTPTEQQGDDGATTYMFTIQVADGAGGTDTQTFSVTASEVNEPPEFVASGPHDIGEGVLLSVTLDADDPDHPPNTLTYSASGLPRGATLSGNTLFWTPAEDQGPGTYRANFTVSDGAGGTDGMTVAINVAEVNQNPVFAASGPHAFDELTILTFDVRATDGDRPPNTLTYSASGLPAGAAFSGTTFTWNATEAQGPGTYRANFTVSDGAGGTDGMTVAINVAEVNQNPVFAASGPHAFDELTILTFDVRATDGDRPPNTLTYSASGLPAGAAFSGTTFTWNATEAQGPGTYRANFRADDGAGGRATMAVDITVNEVNLPHQIIFYDSTKTVVLGTNQLANITGQAPQPSSDCRFPVSTLRCLYELETTSFVAVAVDPDIPFNPTWTADLDGTTAVWTPGGNEARFTWTPTEREGGDGSEFRYDFVFGLTDGTHTVTVPRTIYALEVNQPPAVAPIADRTVNEHQQLIIAPQVTDADLPAQEIYVEFESKETYGADLDKDGAFTWTPTEEQGGGTYEFELRFEDDEDAVYESFNVTVRETNEDPVLDAIGGQSVSPPGTLSFTIRASDADVPADTLAYSARQLPGGADFNATSGAFSWTPARSQDRADYDVVFGVDDGNGGTDSETVRIAVGKAANTAPALDVAGAPSTIKEGRTASFTATATDAESDPVAFSLVGTTHGATMTAGGLFSWTPTEAQGGSASNPYSFTIRANDDRDTTDSTISINATEVNQDPRFTTNGGEGIRCSWNSTERALSWPFELEVADDDLPEQTLQYMGSADVVPGGTIPPTTISSGSFAIPDIPLNATSADNQLVYDFAVIDELMGDPGQPVAGKDTFLIYVNLPGHADYSTGSLCSDLSPN